MKRKWIVLIVLTMLISSCSACGKQIEDEAEDISIENLQENQVNETEQEEEEKTLFFDKELSSAFQEATVVYQGDLVYPRMIAFGDRVLLWDNLQGEAGILYIMDLESAQPVKIDLEIPQEMTLTNVAVDKDNFIHILFMTEADEIGYEIWKITAEGEILACLDISEYMCDIAQRQGILAIPEGMVIDEDGNYYLDTISGTELARVFSATGKFMCNITAENSNLDGNGIYAIEAMIRGKDGCIYGILAQAKSKQVRLVKINGTNGYIESIAENFLPDMQGRYNCIGIGVDCDFLIASIGMGVYAYSVGDDQGEARISEQKYPCNMENVAMCFLQDGRFLISDFNDDGKTFYYMPTCKQ